MKATALFSTTAFLIIACIPAGAQQTTGLPGSPNAIQFTSALGSPRSASMKRIAAKEDKVLVEK
jgi:hypothetical protein